MGNKPKVPSSSQNHESDINVHDMNIKKNNFNLCVLNLEQYGHQVVLRELEIQPSVSKVVKIVFSWRKPIDTFALRQTKFATMW